MELTQYPKRQLEILYTALINFKINKCHNNEVFSHVVVLQHDIEQAIKDITFEETQTTLPKID